VNRQVRQWLSEIANRRMHSETRERPLDRFKPEALRPLPVIPYDYRDSSEARVQKDLRLRFDGNRYCVPHRHVGRKLTIKADSGAVTIYWRVEEVVSYARSWRRGQTFGADRFERVLADERPAARRSQAQQRLLDSLDGMCLRATVEAYLRDMADTDRSLHRQIQELLELIRQYGPEDVADAIGKAAKARAYLSLDQQTSNLFYQVVSTRHSQKRSTIITTNTPFSDWGNILFNTTIADRLVENSEIFLLGGESLRKASRNSAPPEE
jgi:hypothetical protein